MTNKTKQEAQRLYSCICHDVHDGVDRQAMWERELELVINQQVLEALEKVKSKSQYGETSEPMGYAEVVPLSDIEEIEKEYKNE